MTNILPDENAKELCLKWMDSLENTEFGKSLREHGKGKMLGLLLCTDGTQYKACSGDYPPNIPPASNPKTSNNSFPCEKPDLSAHSDASESLVAPCYPEDIVSSLIEEGSRAVKNEASPMRKAEISKAYNHRIQTLYSFHCFNGERLSLEEIYARNMKEKIITPVDSGQNASPMLHFPSGTGDCAEIRLLNRCYSDRKKPLSMAVFYYGNGNKEHKKFYPPCDERCKPLLKHIIGLDLVYLDEYIAVINKPAGLLSIEGKTVKDSAALRFRELYGSIAQPCVHRLDQPTSGLMVLSRTQEAHRILSSDFEKRRVYKEYTALVKGLITEESGRIALPIRLDINNRPVQIVDYENGKEAVTNWTRLSVIKTEKGTYTKLLLIPETGRTHQIRVHLAYGLKTPILNDPLYGEKEYADATSQPSPALISQNGNLALRATLLRFQHPVTKEKMEFTVPFE